MKAVLSTIGRWHLFHLAEQLQKHGALEVIFTGYPRFKLRNTRVEPAKIKTFPWLMTPSMALKRVPGFYGSRLDRELDWLCYIAHDRHVSRNLPECDVFYALSGQGLWSGQIAKARGARYFCDRSSSHIRYQDRILREEHARLGLPFPGVDPRIIEREEAEYAAADAIVVPSGFVYSSFREMGMPENRLRHIPFGVNLSDFKPIAPRDEEFRVLHVGTLSVRKGIHYLLNAFDRARLPHSRLVFVGGRDRHTDTLIKRHPVDNLELTGHVSAMDVARQMSRASVFVLASVEEGFAYVIQQAMACGCPVIATTNTGAADVIADGVEGFIVPIRDPDAIAERLTRLHRDPALLAAMSAAARRRVENKGGWDEYGRTAITALTG